MAFKVYSRLTRKNRSKRHTNTCTLRRKYVSTCPLSDQPLNSLPVLEVDGKKMCQSMAIARYLAREFGIDNSLF